MKKIILAIFLSVFSFSGNLVLTSTQATFSIASILSENTNIKVQDIFGTEESMDSQVNAINNVDFSKFKDATAIIDLQRVWKNDSIYEFMRRENIRIVEIDASYSYQDNSSLALTLSKDDNGDINPYVWLDINNLQKMFKIVAHDLSLIFPSEANKIALNLKATLSTLDKLSYEYTELKNIDSAIVLSNDIRYLVSYLNIYAFDNYKYEDIKKENVKEIMDSTNAKIFLTYKPLKKDIVEAINNNNGKVIVLETANIPREDNDDEALSSKTGIIDILKDNLTNLKR